VICGRALYDGRVDPAEALAIMNGAGAEAAPQDGAPPDGQG
jgi:hypothetical protein